MPDLADDAQAGIDILLLDARYRASRHASPAPTGACLNCDERLPAPQLFCDAGCRDDYQKRARMRGCAVAA